MTHESNHPDYYKEIATRFDKGDKISIMLLGMEIGQKMKQVPGGMMPVQAQQFFQAKYRAAVPAGLVCDLEQKTPDGVLMLTDIVIQWQYIRLMGKTGDVQTITTAKIKL